MAGLKSFLIKVAAGLAGETGWLNAQLNKLAINMLVNAGRNRPHPWTTLYDYIGWRGLTDRTYSARMLPPKVDQGTLPDADTQITPLFAHGPEGQRPCPKSTMLFPAFAQYLTDGFIRTLLSNLDVQEDRRRTTSNHEIDQSPLYGRTLAQTNALRLNSNERGKRGRLKSQMIGDEEYSPFLYLPDGKTPNPDFVDANGRNVLDEPLGLFLDDGSFRPHVAVTTLFAAGGDRVNASPQVAMMNTLFLREHNRLAGMLDANHPDWDDERVFETARNISIVMFIKLVVEEYINHISQEPLHLRMLPEVVWRAKWNRPNWITAEFSLLYRWHSLIPETVTWGGKPVSGAGLLLNNQVVLNDGLANAFVDVSSNGATQLSLHNSANFMLFAEEKAVLQARTNRIAPYNAYRAAMNMAPAASFADVVGRSKNAAEQARLDALAAELKALYGSVDNLEFYVGLFAEPTQEEWRPP